MQVGINAAQGKNNNKLKIKFFNGVLCFKNKELDFERKPNQKDLLETIFINGNVIGCDDISVIRRKVSHYRYVHDI